jgi:hypothetical protein
MSIFRKWLNAVQRAWLVYRSVPEYHKDVVTGSRPKKVSFNWTPSGKNPH